MCFPDIVFHPMTVVIRMTEHVSIFSFKASCSALANSVGQALVLLQRDTNAGV